MKSKTMAIRAAGLIILVLLGSGLGGWYQHYHHEQQIKQQAAEQSAQRNQEIKQGISYKGVQGKTTLQLLQGSHKVGLKHYSFGDMVTSIDGIAGNGPKYWSFYVNGKLSDVGASAYQTKATDTLSWRLQ